MKGTRGHVLKKNAVKKTQARRGGGSVDQRRPLEYVTKKPLKGDVGGEQTREIKERLPVRGTGKKKKDPFGGKGRKG